MRRLFVLIAAGLVAGCSSWHEDVENTMGATVEFYGTWDAKECECFWEELGYDSTAECASAYGCSPEDEEPARACVANALDGPSPPDGAIEALQCMTDTFKEGTACFEAAPCVHASFDLCVEGFFNAPDCFADLSTEANDWIDDVLRLIEDAGCMEEFEMCEFDLLLY